MEIVYYSVLVSVLLLFTAAECLKNEGLLKVSQYLRVLAIMLAISVAICPSPIIARVITEFFGILTFVLYTKDTFTQQKIYPKNLDVPRQLLYKEDKVTGKCTVLSKKEAQQAHEQGEQVFIHATVRVKYETTLKNNQQKGTEK